MCKIVVWSDHDFLSKGNTIFFTRFGLWAHKPFVKGVLGTQGRGTWKPSIRNHKVLHASNVTREHPIVYGVLVTKNGSRYVHTSARSGRGRKIGFNTNHYMRSHIRGRRAEAEWEQNPHRNKWVQHPIFRARFENREMADPPGSAPRMCEHTPRNVKISPSPLCNRSACEHSFSQQWDCWGPGATWHQALSSHNADMWSSNPSWGTWKLSNIDCLEYDRVGE